MSITLSAGWYILAPIAMTLLLPRGRHVFETEYMDGVCSPWQFVIHTFSHLISISFVPSTIGSVIATYMVFKFTPTPLEIAWGMLFGFLSQMWVISFVILFICISPEAVPAMTSFATMLTTIFQGFLVPRVGIPVFLRWIPFLNPIFWAYSSAVQKMLGDNVLPCDKDSPINCASENLNLVIAQFGLDAVNPSVAIFVLVLFIVGFLSLAIASFRFPSWKKLISTKMDQHLPWRKTGNGLNGSESFTAGSDTLKRQAEAAVNAVLNQVSTYLLHKPLSTRRSVSETNHPRSLPPWALDEEKDEDVEVELDLAKIKEVHEDEDVFPEDRDKVVEKTNVNAYPDEEQIQDIEGDDLETKEKQDDATVIANWET